MRASFTALALLAVAVSAAPAPGGYYPWIPSGNGGNGGSAVSGNSGNVNGGSVVNSGWGIFTGPGKQIVL